MNIHIPTQIAMTVMATMAMALAISTIAYRRHADLGAWALGLVLQVLAHLLLGMRGEIPDIGSVVVSNVLITASLGMYAVGLCRFHHTRVPAWVLVVPMWVAVIGFYLLRDDFQLRLVFGSVLLMAQGGFLVWFLAVHRRSTAGRGQYVLMASCLLLMASMGVRLFSVLTDLGAPDTFAEATLSNVGAYFVYLVSTMLLSVGVLTMTQERAEAALAHSESRYRTLIESASEGICVIEGGRLRFVNPKLAEFLGCPRSELVDKPFLSVVDPKDQSDAQAKHTQRLQGALGLVYAVRLLSRQGGERWFSVSGVQFDWQGRPATLNFVTDVTEQRAHELKIHELAYNDTLTHLPNRRLLLEHLDQAMARNQRSGQHSAVVFLDLDNFKPLNDQHGHNAGDLLLIEVANRLRQNSRAMDIAARFGGDEFVVLINGLSTDPAAATAQARQVAIKLTQALAVPYVLDLAHADPVVPIQHRCTASAGLVMVVGQSHPASAVLDQADAAMYQAKAAGKNQVVVFAAKPDPAA